MSGEAPISSRYLCPRSPLLLSAPNQNHPAKQATLAPSLTAIFNRSISTGVFLHDRKKARVSPLFKNGSKLELNNYRFISVIPLIANIYEKPVYDQLYYYLNTNYLLSNCQSEFRSLHITLTALLEATNNWSVNIDKVLLNGVILIDLKKAIDRYQPLVKLLAAFLKVL